MDDDLRAALCDHLDGDADRGDNLCDAWVQDGDVVSRMLISACDVGYRSKILQVKPFVQITSTGRFYDQRGANTVLCSEGDGRDGAPPIRAPRYANRHTGYRNPNVYIRADKPRARGPIRRRRRSAWPKTCTCPNCDRVTFATGLCAPHYQRDRKGKPLDPPIRPRAPNR